MSDISASDINRFLRDVFGAKSDLCEDVGDGWAVACMTPGTEIVRPGSIISGPTVFSLVDGALAYAAYTKIGLEPMALTSELSIRYLRPARGTLLRARAEIHHVGKRSVIGTVVAWTDDPDKPVAVAQGTYVRPVS
jgi:uncharacterized protein (TIGR00369 family)